MFLKKKIDQKSTGFYYCGLIKSFNFFQLFSIRLAFEAIFHKSATLRDANPEQQSLTDITDKNKSLSQIIQVSKKVQLVSLNVFVHELTVSFSNLITTSYN